MAASPHPVQRTGIAIATLAFDGALIATSLYGAVIANSIGKWN